MTTSEGLRENRESLSFEDAKSCVEAHFITAIGFSFSYDGFVPVILASGSSRLETANNYRFPDLEVRRMGVGGNQETDFLRIEQYPTRFICRASSCSGSVPVA
jgi:hypothetical protein